MSKKDGPIVVKLVPPPWSAERLMLGPVELCPGASRWLRETFPNGGTFLDAWERCPRGEWLAFVVWDLAARVDDEIADVADGLAGGDFTLSLSADKVRAAIPYDAVESVIREAMAGRPEVIG